MVIYLGSFVQLCCGEGGILQTNINGVCGECSHCLSYTGFAPVHDVCAFPVYNTQALGCSAWELSKAGPGLCALPRSKSLRFRFSGIPQMHRLGWACVLCRFQVREAQVTRCLASTHSPGGQCILSTPPTPPFSLLCFLEAPSQVCRVSSLGSWSLAATLLADVNRQDLVSNCEPAHRLVEDAISGAEFAPSPSSSGYRSPASLPPVGEGLVCSWLGLLWYSLNPLFCERPSSALG